MRAPDLLTAARVVFRSGVLTPVEVLGVLLRDIVAGVSLIGVSLLRRPRATAAI